MFRVNVLNPEIVTIKGRRYRVLDPTTDASSLQEHDLYENEMSYNNEEDEGDNDDFEIEMLDDSRYKTHFHVSKHYFGSIIGKKAATKMRIEHDTKTEIQIPRQGQDGDVVIFGPSPSNVKAARRRINIIVISSRMKQRATHFISIPINNSDITKNFENFKDMVCKECPNRGVEESLFIPSAKLHLTIGVMCLMDNKERERALKLLDEAKDSIVMPLLDSHQPFRVRMKGLSYMNDDPREIDVLYALVQEEDGPSGLLQKLADELVEHFYKAGFMPKEFGRENVKLHVTLLNSRYRGRSSSPSAVEETNSWRSRKPRESFDGSQILEKFRDYYFGVAEVNDIHLSQLNCVGPDGYYQATGVIRCNK